MSESTLAPRLPVGASWPFRHLGVSLGGVCVGLLLALIWLGADGLSAHLTGAIHCPA